VKRKEQLEGVLGVGLAGAALDLLLDLVLALLPVAGEVEELVLVGPEHRLVLPYVHAGHDVVQVDDGLLGVVADHDEEAALLLLEAIADERGNPRVSVRERGIISMAQESDVGADRGLHCLLVRNGCGCWRT
jgi:hypothetical protein